MPAGFCPSTEARFLILHRDAGRIPARDLPQTDRGHTERRRGGRAAGKIQERVSALQTEAVERRPSVLAQKAVEGKQERRDARTGGLTSHGVPGRGDEHALPLLLQNDPRHLFSSSRRRFSSV